MLIKKIPAILYCKTSLFFVSAILLLSLVQPAVSAENIIVICNKSVIENSVSEDYLQKIFTGDITRWEDNSMVVLTLLKNKDVSKAFLKKYVGMTTRTYEKCLKKKIYTGGFKQPKTFRTESEMIEFVGATSGAVGYVTSDPSTWDTWLIKPLLVE